MDKPSKRPSKKSKPVEKQPVATELPVLDELRSQPDVDSNPLLPKVEY